jgi:glutamate racemase
MKIGVFDSGVGGESVANAIKKAFPDAEVVLKQDKANLPYGNKTPDQLYELVYPILNKLSMSGCDVIVVACNTVSTTIADKLKQSITIPLVTLVPMIKPASLVTKTKVVTVCATPATLKSPRYAELKAEFGSGVEFVEPDCSDWAELIENNQINTEKISVVIDQALAKNSDVIVLGCTHYHWIAKKIKALAGQGVVVLDPEDAVAEYLKTVLKQLD